MPPCTMPKSSCVCPPSSSRHGTSSRARENDRASAAPTPSSAAGSPRRAIRSAGYSVHSSKAMQISAPSAICTSIECSGVKKWLLPSRCDRNRTPSSVTLRSWVRLINLKAARVGEHGARPADEAMQAAHAPNRLVSGPQIKMIGIAENDLRAKRFERVLRHGLHAAGGAHRHEHRRLHGLMRQMQLPAPAAVFRRVEQVECEAHFVILAGEHFAKLLQGVHCELPTSVLRYPMRRCMCFARKILRDATFCRRWIMRRSRMVRRPL